MNPELMAWLKERMDRIEDKVDGVRDYCTSIDKTLVRNTADIAEHIRRTHLLEERVEQVAKDTSKVKSHVNRVNGIIWFVGFVGTILGVLRGLSVI
jgi:tetrahydromethanopterin S-methyltransferase subunit G